ncbi:MULTISPECIES: PIG-L deacetylase family protein [Arthrobacter]|uniref:PIG-L deacetylase family protein n=2 Tax=Arthrobacter TaxID=1663 RepID=A0ABU9KIK2_9MICC|nr:PIG-L deacetylase family protein [Arthrobacter sp. YJM1]MDP5226583.1 PIG-L deacetylase family protein [Arthrobacter sp. YJM1]
MSVVLLTAALMFGAIAVTAALVPRSARWIVREYRHAAVLRLALIACAGCLITLSVAALVMPPPSEALDGGVLLSGAGIAGLSMVAPVFQRSRRTVTAPRRILAIGAHPDDLELACGATLAKLVDEGHEVRTLVMSRGAVGGHADLRAGEAMLGSAFLGSREVCVQDFADTRLSSFECEMVALIERHIAEFQPDLVLTHSEHDYHQDHLAVHLATMRAARQHSSILCFESPSATQGFCPTVYVDVAGYVDVKVKAVSLHKDQGAKAYMTAERVRGQLSFRGSQAKREFAEGFEAVRLLTSTLGDL